MVKVHYRVVAHDGGWAYTLAGVFSEPYASRTAALAVARKVAAEQHVPGDTAHIEYQDEHGLDIAPADNALITGLTQVWERLSQGRLKIFKSCTKLLGEYRLYRRNEKGVIVASPDHALDALRYLITSGLDRAIVEPVANHQAWQDWRPAEIWAG